MTVPSVGNQGTVSTIPAQQVGFQLFERANFKDSIMIHVIDDSKKEKRDFTFSRSLLVKYMKYFDRCLKKISDNDEIDISIHCDA
jgi:predicted AAA+ superfamily ATPase